MNVNATIEPTLPYREGEALTPRSKEDLARWIALSRVPGLGCVNFKKLAEYFVDPTEAFSAPAEVLAKIQGLDPNVIDGLRHFSIWDEMEAEVSRAETAAIKVVPFTDPVYPARLRLIADPPPFLYVKGEIRNQDERAVAVVGSRSASDYGRRVARDLCRGLASLGFTVVSGMARGIDGAAHEAALNAGGRTLAVLGCGADRAYPREHDKLYQRISESGAVISEFPLGTGPVPFNFPVRNRLISGLSLGVVVVEATEKSGSLITASLALEQGREVFAVPGEAGASRSRGTHQLIRQGARLVETVSDIVEEVAPQLSALAQNTENVPGRALPQHLGDEFQNVFGLFQERSLQIDEVIERSGCSPSRVSEILLELELLGYIKQLPGKKYRVEG
jgi:DNA processing protein